MLKGTNKLISFPQKPKLTFWSSEVGQAVFLLGKLSINMVPV